MTDKFMYIPNDDTQITRSVDNNKCLIRLDTQLNEPTKSKFTKSPQGC